MDTGATLLIKGPAPCQDFPDAFVFDLRGIDDIRFHPNRTVCHFE
jgi:hypothetical protein